MLTSTVVGDTEIVISCDLCRVQYETYFDGDRLCSLVARCYFALTCRVQLSRFRFVRSARLCPIAFRLHGLIRSQL